MKTQKGGFHYILLGGYFGHGLERTQLERDGVRGDYVGSFAELLRRLELSLGRHDFRAAFALRLGLFGHRALHVVGERNVLYFDGGDGCAPRLGVRINDILYLLVYLGGLREELVERELADNVAHRGLAYLIGRLVDIFDSNDRLFGVRHVVVGDRRDIYRDVVLGDDFLRLYLHRDGAQGDPLHALNGNENKIEAGIPHVGEFTEEKYHAALVLAQNAYRTEEVDNDREQKSVCPFHATTIARGYTGVQLFGILRQCATERKWESPRGHLTFAMRDTCSYSKRRKRSATT